MAQKAQVGIELITAMIIILLILILITLYSIDKSNESKDIKAFLDVKRTCVSVADNLNTIQQQGKGYYKYFSIPEQVYGNYDYNISMGRNVVEITWDGKAWAVTTIASDVTVHCLDYGLNESNRVLNKGDYLSVTCYRPNLRLIENSFRYWNDNGNVTISVKVENDAQVRSDAFNVSIDSDIMDVEALDPYEERELNHTIDSFPPGGYTVLMEADIDDIITESIESDNKVNRTITI